MTVKLQRCVTGGKDLQQYVAGGVYDRYSRNDEPWTSVTFCHWSGCNWKLYAYSFDAMPIASTLAVMQMLYKHVVKTLQHFCYTSHMFTIDATDFWQSTSAHATW